MKKILNLIPVIVVLIFAGCGGNKADEKSFVVKGNLSNAKKDSIYLKELTVSTMNTVDSAVVSEDGDFYFNVQPKEIGFYVLMLNKNNFITLLIDKGETVEITGDARQLLQSYKVSGSKGSELIWELNKHKKENLAKVDSLGLIYKESLGKPDYAESKKKLDSAYRMIFYEEKNFIRFVCCFGAKYYVCS